MKKSIIWIVIIMWMLIGLSGYIFSLVFEWKFFGDNSNAISFISWLGTQDGISVLADGAGNLGINLFSSAIFLVFVDLIIESINNHKEKAFTLERKRFEVLRMVREDPINAINVVRMFNENRGLLTEQFFGGCDFSNIDLDGLDFTGSNLSGAKFHNSSLVNTIFSRCNMSNVELDNAKLSFSDLTDATITPETLKHSFCLWRAIMPDGRLYSGEYNLPGDVAEAAKLGLDLINNSNDKSSYFNHDNGNT